jgi:hypothetical protein
MTYVDQVKSLAEWAKDFDISEGTLARWFYGYGLEAPIDTSKIRLALFYGRGQCEKARGATRDNALQNLQKINLALEITAND